jgi:hypothetical protein
MEGEYQTLHTYELDPNRWIQVEVTRRWPKYVAVWSIRQRSGDSDFPLASGEIQRMPPHDPADLEHELEALREEARSTALSALPAEPLGRERRKGLFSRIFGG